tara:strand:- start:847 stop:1317 length:471 start_codon:yes stop_codon:yes gene_type:complete
MGLPKKIDIRTEVHNGNLTLNRDVIKSAIEQYEGKEVTLTIKRYYKKRSNDQNAYYFGVIVEHWKNLLRTEWQEVLTKDQVHEFLKQNLSFEEKVDEETGELIFNPINGRPIVKQKSTTSNNTWDQEEYHKAARDLAFEMFNYEIPLPDKELKATY